MPDNYEIIDHLLYLNGEQVNWQESPNHGGIIEPELIVVHYTASDGLQGTIDWLCKEQGKKSVSAHLVVARTGVVWQLVPFNLAAWHAGLSNWDGREWCNNFSIGIENMGWGKDWPEAQIQANIGIIIALHKAYPITATAGHCDVAPGRKPDPGDNYPWDRVSKALEDAGFK